MVTANWSSCLDHLEKHHFLIKNHFGHFLKNIGLILIPSTGHTVKNVLITLGSLSRVFKQRFLSVRGPMEKVMEVEFNKFLLLNQDNKLKRIAFCQREREREREIECVCVGAVVCVCVSRCVCVGVGGCVWERAREREREERLLNQKRKRSFYRLSQENRLYLSFIFLQRTIENFLYLKNIPRRCAVPR